MYNLDCSNDFSSMKCAVCSETLYSLNIRSTAINSYELTDQHHTKCVHGTTFCRHFHCQHTCRHKTVANFIHVVCKSWKLLTSTKITNLCTFWVLLTIFKASNICFVLSNPLSLSAWSTVTNCMNSEQITFTCPICHFTPTRWHLCPSFTPSSFPHTNQ